MPLRLLLLAVAGLVLMGLGWLLLQPPQVPLATFTTISGNTLTMGQLKGKPVLVNFWATTCGACVEEMPKLVQVYQDYHQRGLEIIAVAMPYDPPAQVAQFTTTHKLPFPVALDSMGVLNKQFGDISLTPTTFVYNKQGKQAQHYVGTLDIANLQTFLRQELHASTVD